MTTPWKSGRRHESWFFSDTGLSIMFAVAIIVMAGCWEAFNPPTPQWLVTLVGIAGGALFGAVSGDKRKRDRVTEQTAHRAEETADRAEVKADRLVQVAEQEHPQTTHDTGLPEPTKGEKP